MKAPTSPSNVRIEEVLEDRAKHSHSKSKDLSQADEEEHHHSRKGGRRKGDLDSPAGDPLAAAVGDTVQETSQQETKVRRWNYMRNNFLRRQCHILR